MLQNHVRWLAWNFGQLLLDRPRRKKSILLHNNSVVVWKKFVKNCVSKEALQLLLSCTSGGRKNLSLRIFFNDIKSYCSIYLAKLMRYTLINHLPPFLRKPVCRLEFFCRSRFLKKNTLLIRAREKNVSYEKLIKSWLMK